MSPSRPRFPNSLVLAVACALHAACTGSVGAPSDAMPVMADELCAQLAQTICETDAHCFASTHAIDCTTTQESACRATVQPLVDDPRLGYDELAAGRFVAQLHAGSAACGAQPVDYDAFTSIFTGTGATGADCTPRDLSAGSLRTSALSCAGGGACRLYLRSDGSTQGVCEARADESCSHAFDCGSGQFCDLADHWQPGVWGSCRPLRVDGWTCGSDLECASRHCDGTCKALPSDLRPLVASYSDVVLAGTPLAYLRFGETSGARATDATGNGHDGVVSGTVTHDAQGAVTHETNGDVRLASGSYVRIPAIHALATGGAMTLEAWFRPDGTDANQPILELSDAMHIGPHVWQFNSGDKIFTNLIDAGGASHPIMSDAGTVTAAAWHHVVATFDGTTGALYLDGHRIGTTDMTGPLLTSGDVYVGHRLAVGMGDAASYSGAIDEVAVYDHALPASAVSRHHAAGADGHALNDFPLFHWLR